jgi:hypothetical protein
MRTTSPPTTLRHRRRSHRLQRLPAAARASDRARSTLRNIPGSVVDETIDQATDTTQLGDRTIYYDAKNDITVVQSDTTGKIMSVRRGAP